MQPIEYYNIKFIIIGEYNVGKSTLTERYIYDRCTLKRSTLGVDYNIKNTNFKNKELKLHIWDTAGQERFRSIIRNYYRNTQCALICFSITTAPIPIAAAQRA